MKLPSQYPVLDDRPIDRWKVTELKEELKRRKMTTKGLKEDLIKRLDEAIRNEIESAKGNTDNSFDGTAHLLVETENAGMTPADPEITGNLMHHGDKKNDVDGEMACITTVPLGEQKVQEEEVMDSFNSARDEEMVVHATSVETSVMANVNVIPELDVNVQESQNNDSQKGRENLKLQPENEQIKPSYEDLELNFSDAKQESEVSTVFGFQVKSDSISSDCVSINEKNELKDNIIADNVNLELEDKTEILQPSSNNVIPNVGKLHPMDIEEPLENKVPVEEIDDKKADNAETSKKNDSADVFFPEKLNLDPSSGDNSLEDDALENRQIDSKYNSGEVGDRSEKTEIPVVKEGASLHGMQNDVIVDKKDIYDENKNDSAAPILKRKLHEVGNNETSKRQRWWNSENLKVPEPQSNIASSTTPNETFPSMTLKPDFSMSDSNNSEDAPKERVVPQSLKPPTNSLRIDCFLRPFTLKAVQELLGKSGNITSFWMDNIKTHCYVTYSSVEEATETRNAVYNLQWPPNGGRRLVAEFVDPQEVKLRVEAPQQSPATPVSAGRAIPPASPTLQSQPSPRQLVQKQQLPPPPSLPPTPSLARERLPLPPPPQAPEKVDPPIVTLDDLFRKTKATPRIYYLPLSDDQVAAKLKTTGKNTKQ